ncbi:glutaminyl-peptide cyclotransferase [Hyalangium versicolor]|uniref:glutaminyl-peptide cyclotransferase n=1 Tax=Hyalangium versicolor TaxID=2861190 RepID=UPI001CCDABA0|nr:glutaminyl-peptide cyclotransferase [Hyalangium versicolor]
MSIQSLGSGCRGPVFLRGLMPLLGLALLVSCSSAHGASQGAPTQGFEVVQSWPHDPRAFTEGLVYREGRLYESTGLNGSSSMREVALETGQVLRSLALEQKYFGEGIALFGGKLFMLTWRSHVGFIYDAATFQPTGQFSFKGEGWGLTDDGSSLIMSNGSSTLRFLDPATLKVQRSITVTDAGREVSLLNELEYVKGEIYANVWRTDLIARIDPATGQVKGWIDLTGLLVPSERSGKEDVLNGIAYDPATERLWVTGKFWPRLFQIRIVPK